MKTQFFIFFASILFLPGISCSQFDRKGKSLNVKYIFPEGEIQDSSKLILELVFTNNSDTALWTYQVLEEGNLGDRFYNIYLEMEKDSAGKFKYHPLRFYTNPLLNRMEDSLRHYDLPKKLVLPSESDTLRLSLLEVVKSFNPGKYRFRVHLRTKTIANNQKYDENSGESIPLDTIQYIKSDWMYFEIKNYMSLLK